MRENNYKTILENQNRVIYLENKLKNILNTVEYIIKGDLPEATKSLAEYKESAEHIILSDLIVKSEKDTAPKPHPEDKSYAFLKIILENLGFPVFIKDENSKYLLINSQEAELFGLDENEVIGKHDSYFVHDEHEMEIIQKSDNEVLFENKIVELPTQKFTLADGRSFVFKTQKIPFINPITGKRNILGFSSDITDTVNLDKLKKILIMNGPYL
jgi:PAS domain S-box-containing protein